MNWKPIDTAPKDGTEILLWGCFSNGVIRVGSWGGKRPTRWLAAGSCVSFPRVPTHWMPLPQPPQ